MKHKHHIIPKHMGGTDDDSNLIELTREEHAHAHKILYEKFGKKEDLGAYYLLTGQTDEAMKICCSLGGKKQGKINSESGHMKNIQKMSDCVSAGKKGGLKTISLKKGSFGNTELRLESCKLGGKIQGRINSESGHLKEISKDYWKKVKTGQIQRKRKIWIHNEQLKKSVLIEEGSELPEGFVIGRKIKF
jgi:hypothetical protein